MSAAIHSSPAEHEACVRAFWRSRSALRSVDAARFHSEHAAYDLAMIAGLCIEGGRVLDLGCGACAVANWLVHELAVSVHAVDYMPRFLEHEARHPALTTEVGDARTYHCARTFDCVLSLGVITYIRDDKERRAMYENCRSMLAADGVLFVKAQLGVHKPVHVDDYSEQLGAHYIATYPQIDDEVRLLAEVFDSEVTVTDPYPAALNPHADTRFYYLTATGGVL